MTPGWERSEAVSCDHDRVTADQVAHAALVITILVAIVVLGGILW